jgi:hypothetical protein
MKPTNVQVAFAQFFHSLKSIALMAAAIAMTINICSAADPLRVSCALPYATGQSSPGCVGQHTVVIRWFGLNRLAGLLFVVQFAHKG